MTMEIDVAMLRTKPNVAVAVAMSLGRIPVWRAMSGAWKLGPVPKPAMIWKIMTRAQPPRWFGRSMKRPKPRVMKNRPI